MLNFLKKEDGEEVGEFVTPDPKDPSWSGYGLFKINCSYPLVGQSVQGLKQVMAAYGLGGSQDGSAELLLSQIKFSRRSNSVYPYIRTCRI